MAPSSDPPPGYVIPDGYTFTNTGTCRGCGKPVAWCMTRLNRRSPLDPDGTPHWATCPDADRFRKKKGAHV